MDEIDEHVARRLLCLGFVDARQVGRLAALRPGLGARGRLVERLGRIAGLQLLISLLQSRVDEVAGEVGDGRIGGVLREHDRISELAQQRNESQRLEALVAHLDDVAQAVAVESLRQQFEEGSEIGLVEFLGGRELPEQGAEMGPNSVMPESRKRLMESPASPSTRRLTA